MGPNSMWELSQKLEQKKTEDQERVEAETRSELQQHAQSLRDTLKIELATTLSVISGQLNETTELISKLKTDTKTKSSKTQKALVADLNQIELASSQNRQAALNSMRWGWLKYSFPALAVLATILGANWGLMRWQLSQLTQTQEQITQAQRVLESLPQGVKFAADGKGKSYLVYEKKPAIFETQSGEWATELNK